MILIAQGKSCTGISGEVSVEPIPTSLLNIYEIVPTPELWNILAISTLALPWKYLTAYGLKG